MKILAISGTTKTSKPSINDALLQAVQELLPAEADFNKSEITELPLYLEKYDDDYPELPLAFKDAIKAADAIVIATPEHNRSMPAVLKNALDWSTRPYGETTWVGKPVLIMGATGGMLGTYGAQHHLRDTLAHLGAHALPEPALYITGAYEKVVDGNVADEATREHIKVALDRLIEFTQKLQ